MWACLTSRIVSLSLADCINVADEAVGAVAQLLPSLYEFSLQVSYKLLTYLTAFLLTFQCRAKTSPGCFGTDGKFKKYMIYAKIYIVFNELLKKLRG